MTERPQIAQDDLLDVAEMSDKIERYIKRVLRDQEKNITISALITASINYLLSQCKSIDEVKFYRNLFVQFLDRSISQIKVRQPDEPL